MVAREIEKKRSSDQNMFLPVKVFKLILFIYNLCIHFLCMYITLPTFPLIPTIDPGKPKKWGNARKISFEEVKRLDGIKKYNFRSFYLVRSFVELVPALLQLDGVEYFLSDKLNQDPVEEHFSKQRSRCGGVDNPNLEQYMYTERKLVVAKSDLVMSLRGNTRGRVRDRQIDLDDNRTLPKKKKTT